MARNKDRDRIGRARLGNLLSCYWSTNRLGDLAIGSRASDGNGLQCFPYLLMKRRSLDIQCHLQRLRVPLQMVQQEGNCVSTTTLLDDEDHLRQK